MFSSDAVRANFSDSEFLISFFDYRAYQVNVLNNTIESKTGSVGIILPAFSTEKNEFRGHALFGTDNDTCTIDFKERIIKNRSGRSALISILNVASIISDPADHRFRQPDPYQYTEYLHEKGTLSVGVDSSAYLFVYNRSTGSSNLTGWLFLDGDTLYLTIPPLQVTHRGKLKRTKHLKYDPGIMIVKDTTIYAALDFGVAPVKVYMLTDLSNMQKLKIAAYLSLILSEI
jgi:hypothetical protein